MDEVPDVFIKRVAVKVEAAFALLGQMFLIDVLRLKSRVIGSRHPERGVAFHPVVADHDVLDYIHRVADVQVRVCVGRREEDRKWSFPRFFFWAEISAFFPHRVDWSFDSLWIVCFVHALYCTRFA